MSGSTSGSAIAQTIQFNEIPYTWEVPGTYVEARANYSNEGLTPFPTKVLIAGQMLSTGTAVANTIYPLQRADQAVALFGAGSVAADMAAAFLAANPFTQVDIVGLADPAGGAQATGSISIAMTTTPGGVLAVYIAGIRVAISVASTDTTATIATNLMNAINAIPAMPVTAAITTPTNTVNLTAKHKGFAGDVIDIRLNYQIGDITPAGVTPTISPLVGGTLTVDLTAVVNAIAASWYTDLVLQAYDNTNMALVSAMLETRYAAMGKLDMHAWVAASGTYAALLSQSQYYNSRFRTVLGISNAPQPPWKWAAAMAGVATFNLTNDPARQLRGLALPGILAPAPADRFPLAEQEIMLTEGISTFDVQSDGTVTLQKVVTEYQKTSLGVLDTAWHTVNIPKTITRIRYDWIAYVSQLYPRNKLADDGSLAAEYDDTIVTPRRMKATWAARSRLYEQQGWIEDAAATAAQSVFVRDRTDRNRLNSRQQIRIIGNLMVLAAALEFQV
jgi:phage tail sheath gpL-like